VLIRDGEAAVTQLGQELIRQPDLDPNGGRKGLERRIQAPAKRREVRLQVREEWRECRPPMGVASARDPGASILRPEVAVTLAQ
jgi:hypothetical protein